MEHWGMRANTYVVCMQADAFIREIEVVCKKHNMSIGHEDRHGAFIITKYSDESIEWLKDANIYF